MGLEYGGETTVGKESGFFKIKLTDPQAIRYFVLKTSKTMQFFFEGFPLSFGLLARGKFHCEATLLHSLQGDTRLALGNNRNIGSVQNFSVLRRTYTSSHIGQNGLPESRMNAGQTKPDRTHLAATCLYEVHF